MAFKDLRGNDLALGRAILLATDALDMRAEGAFWLYDEVDEEWRYFLVTSLLENLDTREFYDCLNKSLTKKLSKDEAFELQLYVAAPSELLVKEMLSQYRTSSYVSDPKRQNFILNGNNVKGIIYRLADSLTSKQKSKAKREFRRSCREIAMAA